MASVFLKGYTRIVIYPPATTNPKMLEMVLVDAELRLPGGRSDEDLLSGKQFSSRVHLQGNYVPIELCPFDDDIKEDEAKLLARAVLRGDEDAIWPLIDQLLMTRDRK